MGLVSALVHLGLDDGSVDDLFQLVQSRPSLNLVASCAQFLNPLALLFVLFHHVIVLLLQQLNLVIFLDQFLVALRELLVVQKAQSLVHLDLVLNHFVFSKQLVFKPTDPPVNSQDFIGSQRGIGID